MPTWASSQTSSVRKELIKMGDRVSISFVDYNDDGTVFDESVALFDHYAGQRLVECASKFIKDGEVKSDEPCFAIVEFIHSLGSDFDVYLKRDSLSGDNSDNGHYRVDIKDGSIKRYHQSDVKEEENILKKHNVALRSSILLATHQLGKMKKDLETELQKCA